MVYGKVKKFSDLEAWKTSHKLAIEIYGVTKDFPKEELFGITNQMRRASVSISSNIAEGFSRKTLRDKSQFYTIAKGSLTELESQLLLAKDIKYLSEVKFGELHLLVQQAGKLLTGLIKFTDR